MIYFAAAMRNDETIAIKIGYTARTVAGPRVKQLRYPGADRIVLLATADSAAKTERQWHALYAPYRIEGEWFKPSAEILAKINSLKHDPQNKPAENALLERAIQASLRACLSGEAGRAP